MVAQDEIGYKSSISTMDTHNWDISDSKCTTQPIGIVFYFKTGFKVEIKRLKHEKCKKWHFLDILSQRT